MKYVEFEENLYGNTLSSLIRDMKLSVAHKKINEFTTPLIKIGYSKEELVECIKTALEEDV